MKKKIISFLFSFLLTATIAMPLVPSLANDAFGFGSGSKLDTIAGKYKTQSSATLEERIGSMIQVFLSFLGVIFLILMLYAGFRWMTAAGEEEQITKAKDTIRAALIGLIIVLAAYALSVFVIQRLWGATN